MTAVKDGSALALLLKVLLVALLRRFQPKAVASFELLSLAVPIPDLLAHWMVRLPLHIVLSAGHVRLVRLLLLLLLLISLGLGQENGCPGVSCTRHDQNSNLWTFEPFSAADLHAPTQHIIAFFNFMNTYSLAFNCLVLLTVCGWLCGTETVAGNGQFSAGNEEGCAGPHILLCASAGVQTDRDSCCLGGSPQAAQACQAKHQRERWAQNPVIIVQILDPSWRVA